MITFRHQKQKWKQLQTHKPPNHVVKTVKQKWEEKTKSKLPKVRGKVAFGEWNGTAP